MSFHAYLRQSMDANKTAPIHSPQFIPPLDEFDFKIKKCPAKTHDPFPAGICSKCQPSAISLQSQTFRMVDHVEFENAALVDEFISSWRQTGVQRLGYLYGRYEPYPVIPLGIKAVVSAIYEPLQQGFVDGIEVDMSSSIKELDEMAAKLDLCRVGFFSNLILILDWRYLYRLIR